MVDHADTIREALTSLSSDLLNWGQEGATYDAHAVGDALAALDALTAERDQLIEQATNGRAVERDLMTLTVVLAAERDQAREVAKAAARVRDLRFAKEGDFDQAWEAMEDALAAVDSGARLLSRDG